MSRLSRYFKDWALFGPDAATRAWGARYGKGLARVALPGLGQFAFRGRDSDFSTLRQVFGDEEYALPPAPAARLQDRYEQMLARGETPLIIDAGANIGAAARWFGALYPKARIIAVEPDPANAAILRLNAADHPNIEVVEAAIGARPGHVAVETAASASWGSQTARAETGCPVVTVPDLMQRAGAGDILIAKIDIEGFEEDLFSADTDWLDRTACVMIEPHDWMMPDRTTSLAFQREMGRRAFQVFIRGENLLYVRP